MYVFFLFLIPLVFVFWMWYFFRRKIQILEDNLGVVKNQAVGNVRMLEALFRVNQTIHDAKDENEIVQLIANELIDLAGAQGVTFVPIDDHGQPQAEIKQGDVSIHLMQNWLNFIASDVVRDKCNQCTKMNVPENPENCPLINEVINPGTYTLCFPIQQGDQLFGIFNLFIEKSTLLDNQVRDFINTLLQETALGLEAVRLRRRELSAFKQIQTLKQKSEITHVLHGLLENVCTALEADFGSLYVVDPNKNQLEYNLSVGSNQLVDSEQLDEIIQNVLSIHQPIYVERFKTDLDKSIDGISLLAAPLTDPEDIIFGVIVIAYLRVSKLHQRQLSILQTIAGQFVLVIQNANSIAELEYKTMIQERTRLAREIHDGVAQTLGYLKLQTAQIRNFLSRNEYERAQKNIDLCYETIEDAYLDTREVIDGLRISPESKSLEGWLSSIADEFREMSGLNVEIHYDATEINLELEIQAQLIRIVQEALSNIRKHSEAELVTISLFIENNDYVFEISDNGRGFYPDEISQSSQHGLRGMRERAELIGADFQITSKPKLGTSIILRLSSRDVELKKVT